jgi:outer membrane protein TolC
LNPTDRNEMVKHLVTGFAAVCIFLAALAACRPFEPQQRPSPADSLDRQFSLYTGTTDPLTRWWLSFDDPNLNRLIERALDENLTLKAAWARLQQARALSIQAIPLQYRLRVPLLRPTSVST